MSTPPRVTVLMPVYNGAPYLRQAMDSILAQTFPDFEFLIIDDGSTDDSAAIIGSYRDPRVRLINNEVNRGLIASLNIGISHSRGEYLARMDCDDISHPERLARQAGYLDAHPDCTLVAVKCHFIDADGEECGVWNDDCNSTSYDEIVRRLPRANCIAHPGIMIRREALLAYGYDPRQVSSEDYDLWLRLVADGHRIAKLDEYLISYRLTPLSVTARSNRRHPDLKNVRTKTRFVLERLKTGRFNRFSTRVFLNIFKDLYYFLGKLAAAFFVDCVAGAGRLLGGLLPFKNPSGLFFFFPFFHIGGAERVHADIVNCFAPEHPWVFFCKWSPRPGALRGDFERTARTYNWCLALKYGYPFSAGLMAGFINRHPNAVVFGCNTLFFYKMLPYLAAHVRAVDLLHAFGGGAEDFSLPVTHLLDKRVVISAQTGNDLKRQYGAKAIDTALGQRIVLIENRVDIPAGCPEKTAAGKLNILYVGRGSEEKRVHIAGRVAALSVTRGIAAKVTMVGDLVGCVEEADRPYCHFTGEVTDPVALRGLYQQAHILLLTSSREGFPMVIMEAMAQGVVALATNVGGIPLHLQTGLNGWLIDNSPAEEQIVEEMFAAVENLSRNRDELTGLSARAYAYARENFGGERFCRQYRETLLARTAADRNSDA